jgi:hypothetical protein
MRRERDELDRPIAAELPDSDNLIRGIIRVLRTTPGLTENEIIEKLVEMGWPRDYLQSEFLED